MGRLFYHTAMCLLAQINPLKPAHPHHHDDGEARAVQLHHAHQVCGIVAHTKDHGVASVAIRSLAIAGSVLTEPREQHEILDILTRIYHHTGWNLKRVHTELKRAWGWEPPEPGSGAGIGLPPPPQHQPKQQQPQQKQRASLITPAAQGGTLGAAAVVSQLFGPRDANNSSQQQDNNSQNNSSNTNSKDTTVHRRDSHHTHHHSHHNTPLAQPLFSSRAGGRHGSVAATASPSSHASPASVSTPPSTAPRPTVNPLLAQADFTQPNHPYRDWYKPPERPAAERSGSVGDRTTKTKATTKTTTTTTMAAERPSVSGGTSGGGSTLRTTGGLWPY